MTDLTRVFIQVGEYHITNKPCIISTILGSCVSVCLYGSNDFCAINHFLLPKSPQNSTDLKYGNVSTKLIIQKLLSHKTKNLQAKIFGGANVGNSALNLMQIGAQNVAIAKQILNAYNIPINQENTLNTRGQKISFNTKTKAVSISYA